LGSELIKAEIVVALEFREGLFLGDPVAQLYAGVNHDTCGEDEVDDFLVFPSGDSD